MDLNYDYIDIATGLVINPLTFFFVYLQQEKNEKSSTFLACVCSIEQALLYQNQSESAWHCQTDFGTCATPPTSKKEVLGNWGPNRFILK